MTIIRKLVSGISVILAILLIFIAATYLAFWRNSVDHTIQNAKQLEKFFAETSAFVEEFKQAEGRLPNNVEFRAWTATQPERVHGAKNVDLITSPSQVPQEVITKFGMPRRGEYVLRYWRGEWSEYFVSWAKASTLELDASRFYLLGSSVANAIMLLAIGVVVGVFAKLIWPRPIRTSSGAAAGKPTAIP